MDKVTVEPKWIASIYALTATAVCILIFTYSDVDFFTALLKTFFTAISFYFFGIIMSSLINFIVINFHSDNEQPIAQKEPSSVKQTQ